MEVQILRNWIIEVYLHADSKRPFNQGYIEKPTRKEAIEAAERDLSREYLCGARIEARPLSVAPADKVVWLKRHPLTE